MTNAVAIHWFRQDLRVTDNPGLAAAASRGLVLPVYILDDINAGRWKMGEASRWWLHHSLTALDRELAGKLLVLRGDPRQLLPGLVAQHHAATVTWNRCYEPWQWTRDHQVQDRLAEQKVRVETFNGSLLWEPGAVVKADGSPYRVFTPYYQRGCRSAVAPRYPQPLPGHLNLYSGEQTADKMAALDLLPSYNWCGGLQAAWKPGVAGAREQLAEFLKTGLAGYGGGRDIPGAGLVSRLSPCLHFGELSPHQLWYQLQQLSQTSILEESAAALQRQLAWREFSYYQLFHNPELPRRNLHSRFDDFPWRDSAADYRRWCRGQTGYPLVDAGMRELWQTGYMHNRVRMVAASFLVKNLLIDWRRGADWFWDCLVDADLANNSAGWQWVAGSGADAAPYFRIFNPVTQSRRFDPDGVYIRQFLPELAALPDRYLHDPSAAPASALSAVGLELDRDYPRAMVDLSFSRQRALQAYRTLPARTGESAAAETAPSSR
jgi:deoxyribodipyrimidine photo-lyase